MLIDGYVAEQMKNAMLNSEQEQVKIYDAYYNKGVTDGYNKALKDLLDRIDLMFLYKDTKGIFHSASYANLNRKSIHAVVEQLKK